MSQDLPRISTAELDSWLYCRRRHSMDSVLASCSSAELASVVLNLRSRAAVGDLSSQELKELTCLEEALAARFGSGWKGPDEALDTLTFQGIALGNFRALAVILATSAAVAAGVLWLMNFLEVSL